MTSNRTTVLVGRVSDAHGWSRHCDDDTGWQTIYYRTDPDTVTCKRSMPLQFEHEAWHLGGVRYLERDHRGIIAVAEITDPESAEHFFPGGYPNPDDPMWFSTSGDARSRRAGTITRVTTAYLVDEISIGRTPAAENIDPVISVPGPLDRSWTDHRLPLLARGVLERAWAHRRDPLQIHDIRPRPPEPAAARRAESTTARPEIICRQFPGARIVSIDGVPLDEWRSRRSLA